MLVRNRGVNLKGQGERDQASKTRVKGDPWRKLVSKLKDEKNGVNPKFQRPQRNRGHSECSDRRKGEKGSNLRPKQGVDLKKQTERGREKRIWALTERRKNARHSRVGRQKRRIGRT